MSTLPSTPRIRPVPAEPISDADYRLMVESSPDHAIFLLDPGGFILSWNAGARLLKGYEAPEVIGQHFSLFYPEERVTARWPEHELEMAARNGRFEDEGWRVRKDGTLFWANVVITRLTDEHGLRGFSKITRDLTERRRQEELLRESEERFRLILEHVQDYAIFLLDPEGRVQSWNLGAQKAKGYEAQEIIGEHFSRFYPPEVIASGWPQRELEIALEHGRVEDEGWRLRKDGTRFWASVVITSLFDHTGRHRGFAKVTRDLTDRRRISALEDEGRRLTTFLAMLGHELRNPLAPISNALGIMQMLPIESAQVRLARDVIARQMTQMTRLVDDLLDLGRITSGKVHLETLPVRLQDVVADAVEAVLPQIRERSHALAREIDPDDAWVCGDRVRLVQVVVNLLGNAAKFTPPGGHLHLALLGSPASVEIRVRDDGPGIAPAHLANVFNLFVQGEQDPARSQGGMGLGLSLVQQLVTLQGGEVFAFSTGQPGKGAEFVVRLPRIATPADAPEPGTVPAASAGGRRRLLLVVDDNLDSARTLGMLLEHLGYRVDLAYDGPAGLARMLAPDPPEMALLDIGLPGMDGLEVARQVRARSPRPPVLIALSGYDGSGYREQSAQAGFAAHLPKPLRLQELTALLERWL